MTKGNETLDDRQSLMTVELFPDFKDEDFVKVLTEIKQENQALTTPEDKQKENEMEINKPASPKTINYSSMANIVNVNCTLMLHHMYFLHSNVSINYNISK